MAEKNLTIMRTAYFEGTNDFQQRVPEPTQQNLQQVYDVLLNNPTLYNQFCDTLINRIGLTYVRQRKWENPLAGFKGSKLLYGSTIQEIIPKWIKAHCYKDDVKDLLEMNRPALEVAYHTMDRQDKYPISITRDEMRQAFINETGLNDLLTALLQVPYNSDNYDEYKIMLELITKHEKFHGFFKQHMDSVPADEKDGKEFLRLVRQYVGALKFPTTTYTARDVDGVPVFAKSDELILLYTPQLASVISVEVLASLFNVDKAELNVKTVLVDEFPIKDCFALLTTRDWFVCNDTEYTMQNFYNGSTLTVNYYLHHWGVYSTSPFVPAIMFTTGKGSEVETITQIVKGLEINAEKTVAKPGEIIQLFPNLYGTFGDTDEVKPKTSCTYMLKYDETYQNARTFVDKYNRLHIQKSAIPGDVLHVKATSTYNNPSEPVNANMFNSQEFTADIDIKIDGGSPKDIYLKSPVSDLTLDTGKDEISLKLEETGERTFEEQGYIFHVPTVSATNTEELQEDDVRNATLNAKMESGEQTIICANEEIGEFTFPITRDFATNKTFEFSAREDFALPEVYGALITVEITSQEKPKKPNIIKSTITDSAYFTIDNLTIDQPKDVNDLGKIRFARDGKFVFTDVVNVTADSSLVGVETMLYVSTDGGASYTPYVKGQALNLDDAELIRIMLVAVGKEEPTESNWLHYQIVPETLIDKKKKKNSRIKK